MVPFRLSFQTHFVEIRDVRRSTREFAGNTSEKRINSPPPESMVHLHHHKLTTEPTLRQWAEMAIGRFCQNLTDTRLQAFGTASQMHAGREGAAQLC